MLRVLVLAGLVLLSACSAVAQRGGDRLAKGQGATSDVKLQYGGVERRYLISDFSGGKPAPVVIVLHGGGGHPENAQNMSQMDVIARREKFIAIYPAGTGGVRGRLLTWNAGHCCASALENKVDDVGFVSAIIDELLSSGRADPKRIYVTGMSNGAMMSHVVGRELSGRVAAIAPIVGAVFGDELGPKGPVAAIIFVGQDDQSVPAAGGPLGGATQRASGKSEDRNVSPDIDQATYWAKANGCGAPVETRDQQGKAVEIRWETCTSGKPVHFYRVTNNGHAWPGGKAGRAQADQPTQDMNASEIMWRFFAANPKP